MKRLTFGTKKTWAMAAALLLSMGVAQADNWPSRPLRIVVPFPPGATPDIMARLVGDKLSQNLGQPVVVENKPGGAGVIAAGAVQHAAPDGYTLLLADTGHLAINPALMKDLPYDPIKDFIPVSRLTEQNFSVIVRAESPARTVQELVQLSKQGNRELTYGTPGIGSVHHIGSERLRLLSGGKFMHVPYKGAIQTVPALLSGEIDFMVISATPVMAHWKSDKVRILARGSAQRSPLMADVPTLTESGVPLIISITLGMLAPAGTPPDVIQRLSAEVNKVLDSPDVQQKVSSQDFRLAGTTPQEYAKLVQAELREYKKVIDETGIKAQ